MDIDFNASPNFELNRRGNKPEAFVLHVTEGNFLGALEWCKNPASQVSYHFIINKQGMITQLVETKDTAWHAGKMVTPTPYGELYGPNPNFKTIGIAYAGFAKDGPNLLQIVGIVELLKSLSVIHSIPLDRQHLIAHHDIRTDKICPGAKVNFDAILYMCSLT